MAGEFRLSDYYFLFSSIRATGGLNKMVGMMPGMSGMVSEENMFEAQRKMLLSEKIFNALTEEEKENPEDLCNYVSEIQIKKKDMINFSYYSDRPGARRHSKNMNDCEQR